MTKLAPRIQESRDPPHPRTGLREAVTLLLALLCALLILEGGLRVYHRAKHAYQAYTLPPVAVRALVPSADPELIYEWNPGWSKGEFSVNEYAMADRRVSLEKPEGVFRIAFLGDSITASFELLSQSETYVAALRAALEREPVGIPRVETLNFAVNGYSLLQSARMLETRALRFDPDLVILQLCLNDPHPSPSAYTTGEPTSPSRLWNFIERRIAPDRFWASWFVGNNYDAQGIENLERGFQRVSDVARGGPHVLAVLFPYLYAPAYSHWSLERYHALYREAAAAAGVAFLDLYEPFRDAGLITARPQPADPIHPNAEAHAFAATRIMAELDRLGYLPAARARSMKAP